MRPLSAFENASRSMRAHSQMDTRCEVCMQRERLGWAGMGCDHHDSAIQRQQQARRGSRKHHPFRRAQDSISAAQPQSGNSQRLSQAVIQLQAAPYLHMLLTLVQQSDVPSDGTCDVSSAER